MDQSRSLRVFVKAIDEGSFAAAARALDLAPAVVTRTVAELEAHLGARLVNRTTRRLALTEIGEAYLARARRILLEMEEADAMAGSSSTEPAGQLHVLAPPAFAMYQLARHLPGFRAKYPQVGIELTVSGPVDTIDEDFDVCILSIGQQGMQGDFIARRLACSKFIACATPEYLARRGSPRKPSDLIQHDGIWPNVRFVRQDLTLYRDGASDKSEGGTVSIPTPKSALSTNHIATIYAAALAGLGIAGLPSFVVDDALRSGALQRVLPQWHGITLILYAAMPSRKHVPARTRAFVDYLLQTFGGGEIDPWLASK
ncbi:MAG: LysR substrate-binding domain-containing protein [Burkholderiales bacterium]